MMSWIKIMSIHLQAFITIATEEPATYVLGWIYPRIRNKLFGTNTFDDTRNFHIS